MPIPRFLSMVAAAAALAVLAGCGADDDTASAPGSNSSTKTVEIEMRDNAYSPTTIDVDAGETVRFLFTNTGKVTHEAYVGDPAAQAEHADEMESMGSMDHGDDDVLVLEPGQDGDLTHTFDQSGTVQIGCHQPGHFEAGMVLDVAVG